MGTFGSYTGAGKIKEKKKEEFTEAVSKILYYGGMMHLINVEMYGKKILLLDPVTIRKGEDVGFNYNYFEDGFWEKAYYKYDDQCLRSEKIGYEEFNAVITAVYCLYELYDEDLGLAEINGEIVQSAFYIGWINKILGTAFSAERRFRLWDQLEAYVVRNTKFNCSEIKMNHLLNMLPKSRMKYAGGTDLADLLNIINGTEELTKDKVIPGTYPDDVLKCKETVKEIISARGEKDGYASIIKLIKERADIRKAETDRTLKPLADMSLYMPARVPVYLAAELTGKKFWVEWKELWKNIYHDEVKKEYASSDLEKKREEAAKRPVAPVRTSDALKQSSPLLFWNTPEEIRDMPCYYLNDDDRLYWWDGSDEVVVSEAGNSWLDNVKTKYGERLETIPDECDTQEFVKGLIELLFDVEKRYKRVFAFQDMFYEFIANGAKKEYRAAIELLREFHDDYAEEGRIIEKVGISWTMGNRNVKCNPGRMKMRAYLSLLANKKLRMEFLGF